MSPRVSVLLPTTGDAPHLRAALRSLAWQTLAEHEVLIVDDGLGASARALVEARARRDPRLRLLACDGRGLCAALNTGIGAARASWIARMDDDDLCHPARLEHQLGAAEQAGLELIGCQVRAFPAPRITARWRLYERWQNSLLSPQDHLRDLWVESPLCHPSVLIATARLRELGGYREGDFPEDYDLWLRLAGRGIALAKLAEPLLLWRDSAARLTRQDGRYRADAFRALKARQLIAQRGLAVRGVLIWGAGKEGKALGRALQQAGVAPRAYLDIDPRKIGGRIGGAPVLAPDARPWQCVPQPLVVVAVGTPGVRETVREGVRGLGLVEGPDFVMAA